MRQLSESDIWELIMQAGEAQAKLSELQLKLISLTKPDPAPEVIAPPPVAPTKDKDDDVPF